MYSTSAYLYHQKHRVVLIDTALTIFNRRYDPVYSKKLTLNRGVDTVLLFEFINQDQKPVNITGSTFTFRAIAQDGKTLLFAQDLVVLNAATGKAKLTVASETLDVIEAQPARWSIERESGVLFEGVYVDDQASAQGFLDIVDSVYPEFVASSTVTIPAGDGSSIDYSSAIETQSEDLTTLQITPSSFTGTIQMQGATSLDDDLWYDIGSSISYTNSSTRGHVNVAGFHPYLRLAITTTSGSISNITYR